jgi:hypothetical protein
LRNAWAAGNGMEFAFGMVLMSGIADIKPINVFYIRR